MCKLFNSTALSFLLILTINSMSIRIVSSNQRTYNCHLNKNCQYESLVSRCNDTDTVYNENLGKCIQQVEIGYNVNANCARWDSNMYQCGLDAETTKCDLYGSCRCKDGFGPTGDNLSCVEGKQYGEQCNNNDENSESPCDAKYECSDKGICTCRGNAVWNSSDTLCYSDEYCAYRHFGTFFDASSGLCKCLVGRVCEKASLSNESLYCPLHSIVEQFSTDIFRCVCEIGYTTVKFEVNNTYPKRSHCVQSKAYSEFCDDTQEEPCDVRSRSTCIDGVCNCNATTQFWNEFERTCELKVGQRCRNSNDRCTRNAICNYWSTSCACESAGYAPNADGKCLGKFMTSCIGEGGCQEGLHCVDGFCNCAEIAGQIYNNGTNRCIGLIGSVCHKPGDNNNYVGECVESTNCDSNTGLCECDAGLVRINRIRDRCFNISKYGESCSNNGWCDFSKGLACIDGVCNCVDSRLTYINGGAARCVAPIGYKCGDYKKLDSCSTWPNECNYYYSVQCDHDGFCTDVGNPGNPNLLCLWGQNTK